MVSWFKIILVKLFILHKLFLISLYVGDQKKQVTIVSTQQVIIRKETRHKYNS
jgi:hypothetical protein